MGLYSEIDNASNEDLIKWWAEALPLWTDERGPVLEEIAHALIRRDPSFYQILRVDTHSLDSDKRQAALVALSYKGNPDLSIAIDLRDAFFTSDVALKTAALWGFINLDIYPLPRAELESLIRQPDERLSALAMTYLSYAFPDEAISLLHNGLQSQNPRQREYACDVVGDRGLVELRPDLISLRDDPDEYVRQAAESNLAMLEGN